MKENTEYAHKDIIYKVGDQTCIRLHKQRPKQEKQILVYKLKIFELYGYKYSETFGENFTTGGGFTAWLGILFTAGFTPLPFKLLTISSGIINFNLTSFIFICIITRGLRFFLVAYLTYKFGEKIGPFLDKEGTKWSIIIVGIIIVIAAIIYLLYLK